MAIYMCENTGMSIIEPDMIVHHNERATSRLRYDKGVTIMLSSIEDSTLLEAIDHTYGNSTSERARNLFRAAFDVYQEYLKNNPQEKDHDD